MGNFAINTFGTEKGDWIIRNGNFVIVTGLDEIAQKVFFRMSFFLGEWFLDLRIGIPYYQQILIKNADFGVVEGIFREAILTTPGVTQVQRLDLGYDGATRELSVSFDALTVEGRLTFDEEFIIDV